MKLLKMIRVHNQLDQDIHIIINTYSSSLTYKKQKTNHEDQGSIFKGVNANYFLKNTLNTHYKKPTCIRTKK